MSQNPVNLNDGADQAEIDVPVEQQLGQNPLQQVYGQQQQQPVHPPNLANLQHQQNVQAFDNVAQNIVHEPGNYTLELSDEYIQRGVNLTREQLEPAAAN